MGGGWRRGREEKAFTTEGTASTEEEKGEEGLEGGVEGAQGAEAAEAGEEFVGGGNVAGDLEAEIVRRGKLFFFTKPLPETDFNVLGSEVAGIIEQVSFDGEGGTVEGGTHANVGDTAMAAGFTFEDGAGDVDAASGKQFLVGLEI